MATNATFTWIAQSGTIAQQVWYGQTSIVGSTLPPATGWNQGANLYSPTATSATLNNLQENTMYNFAVESVCSTGASTWSIIQKYKLLCPAITSAVVHTNSVDISVSVINASQLALAIGQLVLAIADSSGNVLQSVTYSGAAILSTINNTFTGLTPATPYNVLVKTTPAGGGAQSVCSTTAITAASLTPCTGLSFTVTNVTATGFKVIPSGLNTGDTYDVSTDNGNTFVSTANTGSSAVITVAPGVYTVILRRNCIQGGSALGTPQNVTVQGQIQATIAMNSSINSTTAPFAQLGTLYLTFTFPQPTPVQLTLWFGFLFEESTATSNCSTGTGYLANGTQLFTPPNTLCYVGGIAAASFVDSYDHSGTGIYPFSVTIPAGTTTYNSGTSMHTTYSSPEEAWFNISSRNALGSSGTIGRGYTDLYVHIAAPTTYSPNFTIISGSNVNGVTIHNV